MSGETESVTDETLSLSSTALNLVSQGVVVADANRLILSINHAFASITGYSSAESIGRNCKFLQGPLTDPETVATIRRSLKELQSFTGEILNYRKDGRPFWNDLHIAPVLDGSGALRFFIGVTRDITDRVNAERVLRESEERLQMVLLGSDLALWDWRLPDSKISVNERWWTMLGLDPRSPLTPIEAWNARVHPEDQARFAALMHEVIRNPLGREFEAEIRVRHQDGQWVWILDKGAVVERDAQGKAIRVSGTHLDISARKAAEEDLRRSEASLAITLNSIGDAVIATDTEGRVTRMNPTAERLTGWSLAEALGLPLTEVFQIVDSLTRLPTLDPVARVIASGSVVELSNHTSLLARDGSQHQISDSAAPIRDAQGTIAGVVLVFTDISEAYRVRSMLESMSEVLERTSAMAKVGGWEMDLVTGTLLWSNETCRIHEIDGRTAPHWDKALHFYPAKARSVLFAAIFDCIEQHKPFDLELPLVTAKGRDIWVRTQCSAVVENGRAVKLRGAFHDITDRRTAAQRLQESHDLLSQIGRRVPGMVYQFRRYPDGRSCFPFATEGIRQIYEVAPEQVRERADLVFSRVHPKDLTAVLEAIRVSGETLQAWNQEYRVILPKQGERWRFGEAQPERLSDGSVLWHGFITDVTERKEAEANMHRLAHYDLLTGLPNRRLLLDRIARTLATAQRSGQVGALLFVDLDNFKHINDARGHSVGDLLLRQVADRLQALMRPDDTVARLGGDEFVILAGQLGLELEGGAQLALKLAERVRETLSASFLIGEVAYSTSGSIGITMFPRAEKQVGDLLREADIAMYRAKASGRNRVAFFEANMQAEVEHRLALEQDLKSALLNRELELYVQPQVNPLGQELGGELLLRWSHRIHGQVSPAQFIPVAESSGLILAIGDWVIETACAALVRLQAAGLPLTLSVNVSPRQFHQDGFVDGVRRVLEQSGALASGLIFELTEGLLIENWEATAARMAELVALGVRFSIDDFGTGYSSLAYLKRLPIYELKIDKSFVHDTPHDASGSAIVEAILSVARHLNLSVVAEGVETRAQADSLIASGCTRLQGHLFSKAQPLESWLKRHGAG